MIRRGSAFGQNEAFRVPVPILQSHQRSRLLRALPIENLERIASHTPRPIFHLGEVLFREGDPADTFHVVEASTLKVAAIDRWGGVTPRYPRCGSGSRRAGAAG